MESCSLFTCGVYEAYQPMYLCGSSRALLLCIVLRRVMKLHLGKAWKALGSLNLDFDGKGLILGTAGTETYWFCG